jgi:CHC2 zinc finger/Toprim domain
MASEALKREVTPEDEAGRQFGKTYDLAFGFGGGVGAWRKFDTSDTYSDAEIEKFKNAFRQSHKATVRFWRGLENAACRSIRTGKRIALNRLAYEFTDGTLYLTLPSGRRLVYPEARLGPGKYEDAPLQVYHKDNGRGRWKDCGAWYGTLVENVVQATARDLLAAAMLRLEAAGYQIAFHVHDEVVTEVPQHFGSADEFRRLMMQLPEWAEGLPIAAKVWTGERYAKTKITPKPADLGILSGPHVALAPASRIPRPAQRNDANDMPSLTNLINEPMVDRKICCPFHDDSTPSLHVYDDHFHCFGCGAHGDHIDWLMMVEGLDRNQAIEALKTWDGPKTKPRKIVDHTPRALELWEQAKPITGTLAAQYLGEKRKIDLAMLPPMIDDVLRFHPCCPFNGHAYPCLLALMRNATTDVPTGIHRVALTPNADKIERRMFGRAGVVKLWPATDQLVIGEGIETVLAAATRIPYRGAPLRPAWAALSSGALGSFPVLPNIEKLILLVDNDINGVSQTKAACCTERWNRAGRNVEKLMPKRPDTDFNDIIMERQ